MGLDQGPSRQDPTHCRPTTILTVSPFEMYSGGFSKYEDLSNEFSILLQRRVLPCSCQRCSAVCEAQVEGGHLCLWNGQAVPAGPQTPRKLLGASSSASAWLSQRHTPALLFVQRTWKWGLHPSPPSPRCNSPSDPPLCREEGPWLLRQIVGFPYSPPPFVPPYLDSRLARTPSNCLY